MKQIYYTWRTYLNNIRHIRIIYFMIVIFIFLIRYNRPLLQYSADMDYPVTIWVFPFLMSSFSFLTLFYFLFIYINTDLPFMQRVQMYQILRMGRKRWIFGQIGYLLLRSFTMVLLTFFLSVIALLPHVELEAGWGKLIQTAALTGAQSEYDFQYPFFNEAFIEFTPLQLLLLTISICTLILMLISMAMLVLCLYINRSVAVSFAVGNVVLLFMVNNTHPRMRMQVSKFVPVCWAEVARVATPAYGFYWLPSVSYMLTVLIIAIIICSVLVVRKINTIEFNWEDDL